MSLLRNFNLFSVVGIVCLLALFTSCKNRNKEITDINHIVHLGQSLGAGEHSLPIVTDSATGFGNLSFKIGTHTYTRQQFEGQPELRDENQFSFIPLTAHERGHEGETIANGLCDHLTSTSKSHLTDDARFLFSFSGQGGRLLRELDKAHDEAKDPRSAERRSEGGYYKTAVDDIKRAKQTAGSEGLSYSVFAITWMQGESNTGGNISRWEKPLERNEYMNIYMNDLIQLKNDLQQDITEITGQVNRVPFFTYQTFGSSIGSAQLMASDKDPDIYMVAPTYMMPNGENSRIWNTPEHGDGIHLTADGERWLGEMFGKVVRKVIFEKVKWEPLRPTNAWLADDKKHIRIKFLVPTAPLVLDTLLLPKQGTNFGFEVYNGNSTIEIKTAVVVDGDIIELELANPLEDIAGWQIRYGLQSYVKEVSEEILNIGSADTVINTVPHITLEYKGDITKEFRPLADEGVFTLANRSADPTQSTDVLVRKVYLNKKGNTILLAEKADLNSNIPFQAGQRCYVLRRFSYGNVRDSDPEQSIFSFKDNVYGNRHGQRYPLFNWSVVFQDLPIEASGSKK